jgi:carboxymethylenebutenolidase
MDLAPEHVTIPVLGGEMPAFLCRPQTDDRLPAVIVIHEIFGPDRHFEDLACRFAGQGYAALSPDLFWQLEVPSFSDRASFMRFRQSIDDRRVLADLDACLAYLRRQPFVDGDHLGIVGFCWGGSYSLLEAAHNPTLAACVDFYGGQLVYAEKSERKPVSQLEAAEEMHVPFLGLFGEDDQSIPVDQVHQLERVLQRSGVPFEIHIYPGAGHAFFNDTRPTYREHAARDAWSRVLDFFARYLQA